MVKKTWWVAVLFVSIMLLSSVSSVVAATSNLDFTTWPAKTTTDVNKVWTISFTVPLLSTSVNNNTIYVLDSKLAKIATTVKLSADALSAVVIPAVAYTAGDYSLYITNGITSQTRVKLVEQIMVPFTVVVTPPTTVNYILDVQSTFNSLITSFKVKTAPNVYRVDVNKTKMQYIGKNTYSAGVYGAKQGNTITFEAYDQNNKLIQTYKYQL
ncbi:MAG: hypothetical protein WA131_10590 [Desulfitobacteriaceae bacterium]